jgi:ADP-ribosyl-[dinitrogen reductase] hydrolase
MLGAIIGDVIGSTREWANVKSTDFNLYEPNSQVTDDSVMSIAVANWILRGDDLVENMLYFGRKYPDAGYGGTFKTWLKSDNPQPYDSWGNGSAMRVSPVGWAFETLEETLKVAEQTAIVSHNHYEGIKGAKAVAGAIFLARTGASKAIIKDWVEENCFGYNLSRTCDEIRPYYKFDVSCLGSVPEAIISFLESTDFESAIRLAISLGGDSDTIACIAGSIAEAFYQKIPIDMKTYALLKLPEDMTSVLKEFHNRFSINIL